MKILLMLGAGMVLYGLGYVIGFRHCFQYLQDELEEFREMAMMQCDRCGRSIPYPHIVRFTRSVGLVGSVFNVKEQEYYLCNSCTKSFNRWVTLGLKK